MRVAKILQLFGGKTLAILEYEGVCEVVEVLIIQLRLKITLEPNHKNSNLHVEFKSARGAETVYTTSVLVTYCVAYEV